MKNKSRNFFLKAKPISLSPSFRKMLFMDFYLMEFAFSPVGGATAAKILTSKKIRLVNIFAGVSTATSSFTWYMYSLLIKHGRENISIDPRTTDRRFLSSIRSPLALFFMCIFFCFPSKIGEMYMYKKIRVGWESVSSICCENSKIQAHIRKGRNTSTEHIHQIFYYIYRRVCVT